ncbi:hypothetical protein DM02DRAFT_478118, partial [Periconia macrospinosa]
LVVFIFAASALGSTFSPITTSAWLYAANWTTDKVGWEAAVIDVQDDRTTLAIIPDQESDQTALGLASWHITVTIAPTYYGEGLTVRTDFLTANTAKPVVEAGRIDCTKSETGDVGALCTVSYGPIFGYLVRCNPPGSPTFADRTVTVAQTMTHSYPSRGSYPAGTETLTKVETILPYTISTPSWCSGNATTTVDMRVVSTFSAPKERFPMAQLTITTGMEKLPLATSTSSSTQAATQNRGASVPVKTVAPIFAGLAVAAAFV